jgi:hypothetical protein
VTVSIEGSDPRTVRIDERRATSQGRIPLGKFRPPQGRLCRITVSNAGTDGHVVVDGLQLLPTKE